MRALWWSGLGVTICLAAAGQWLAPAEPRVLVALLLAFVPYSIAVWHAPRLDWRRAGWVILLFAVATRVILLAEPATLSTDVHRYHWEGTVQRAGFNPYQHAPDAPLLQPLRDDHWQAIAHREVPSAYPPLLLAVFRLGAWLSPGAGVFKWVFAAFDVATIFLLAGWLRARGQNPSLVLVWAWHPLVILEFAGLGHEMSLAIFWFVAGLWCLESGDFTFHISNLKFGFRPALAGVCFAASMLSHLFALPLVAVVIVARRIRTPSFWIPLLALSVLLWVPYLDAGRQLGLGLLHFGSRWEFNGSLFEALVWLFDDDRPRQLATNLWLVHAWPKFLAATAWLGVAAWAGYRRCEPARAAFAAGAALLLLSPTVHPWYVTWIVALLACPRWSTAWWLFSATVLLSYAARLTELLDGFWYESTLIRWLEYGPFFALLITESWRSRLTVPAPTATIRVAGVSRSR